MICRVNASMDACGVYEIKQHYLSPNQLRQDQRFGEKCSPAAVMGRNARILNGVQLMAEQ